MGDGVNRAEGSSSGDWTGCPLSARVADYPLGRVDEELDATVVVVAVDPEAREGVGGDDVVGDEEAVAEVVAARRHGRVGVAENGLGSEAVDAVGGDDEVRVRDDAGAVG